MHNEKYKVEYGLTDIKEYKNNKLIYLNWHYHRINFIDRKTKTRT
jgi:hypothetical protein